MKRNDPKPLGKFRVRTWLTVSLTSFIAIGLVLLLIFQTVFLEDLYEAIKIHMVKTAAGEIGRAYDTDNFEDTMSYWVIKEECEIYVVDENGQLRASRGVRNETEHLSSGELRAYYDLAANSKDGSTFSKTMIGLNRNEPSGAKPPKFPKPEEGRKPPEAKPLNTKQGDFEGEIAEQLVFAKLTESKDGQAPLLVLISTVLTPIGATVRVLQVQFLIAMVVFLILAILLSWFISRVIAQPIVRINTAAKGLSSGTYEAPKEGSYREIAELRQTLTKIDGELRKGEQLQRDLIANVSHDLRTPLTMIIGYSEAIRDLPGEDSAENIQVVIDEATRLTKLVNDVLDLSKLQSGVERFELLPVKLSNLLQDVVLRVARMTEKEGYTVCLQAEDEVTVAADDVRLSQVIYNLLANALVHTGKDKTVTVQQMVCEDRVRVSFTDSGKGIPEEERSNIWLRYYQVHGHERRQAMNSGLGLSIVHALVQHHGGTCGVDSVVGKGSTFWFELPLI